MVAALAKASGEKRRTAMSKSTHTARDLCDQCLGHAVVNSPDAVA